MDRRRVLWLTKGLGRGGVERLLVDMYPLVDGERFEVDVAYVLPWKDSFHGDLEALGAEVTCLGSGPMFDVRWVGRLRRLQRDRRYGLVHTHSPVPATAARLIGLLPGGPALVHTEHNLWDRYHWATRITNSATYHRNGAAIAVSETVARSIDPLLGPRSPQPVTIHHGTRLETVRSFDAAERADRRASLGLPVDGFVVGNVANFTPKKNHRLLLEAIAADGPTGDAHLVLVGLGPLEAEIRAAADRLGVGDRTTFLGSRDDVPELLPLFDAFVLSSTFEGFPISLVEAMAAGVACVATDVGGVGEIVIDRQSGLLVPSGDRAQLTTAIASLMTDAALRSSLGAAGRRAAEEVDLRTAVSTMERLYEQVLGGDC